MSIDCRIESGSNTWVALRRETGILITKAVREYEADENYRETLAKRRALVKSLSEKWERKVRITRTFVNDLVGNVPLGIHDSYKTPNYSLTLPTPKEKYANDPKKQIPRVADLLYTIEIPETDNIITNLRELYPNIFQYPPQ